MRLSYEKLQEVEGLNVIKVWVQAGTFSHRHTRSQPDPIQIEWRQMYVNSVPNNEWFLILDSDELIFGSLAGIPGWIRTLESKMMREDIFEGDEPLVATLTEILPNMVLKQRPRLIKKKAGMEYGFETQKHDELYYCTKHRDMAADPLVGCPTYCVYGINLLGPKMKAATLDHLAFLHYKNGSALTLYSDKLQPVEKEGYNTVTLGDYLADKLEQEQ